MAGYGHVTTGLPITVDHLTKQFGHRGTTVTAVDDLSFEVSPGRVTGFLGPNGAGKTTTLRCLLGLVAPTKGSVLIGDTNYAHLRHPATVVGASLEASGFHPGRTARNHLRVLARASDLPVSRADVVLEQVGLTSAAQRRAGGFSLGMRQRLALAAALLGDPGVLLLDEPANGLDPEGIAWLRGFLRHLASTGCTVLVSSHVLSEVQQTVDDVIIISRGSMVQSGSLEDLTAATASHIRVSSPDREALATALRGSGSSGSGSKVEGGVEGGVGVELATDGSGALEVTGLSAADVGHLAYTAGLELHELHQVRTDLEDVFLQLTQSGSEYNASIGATTTAHEGGVA